MPHSPRYNFTGYEPGDVLESLRDGVDSVELHRMLTALRDATPEQCDALLLAIGRFVADSVQTYCDALYSRGMEVVSLDAIAAERSDERYDRKVDAALTFDPSPAAFYSRMARLV